MMKNMPFYINPIDGECLKSPFLFSLPRKCGYERNVRGMPYFVDGSSRPGNSRILFKYTISGEGELTLSGKSRRLRSGDAFLVEVPGNYVYRLPEDSPSWEFLYLVFWYPQALEIFRDIIAECGNIFRLNPDGVVIQKAWTLFRLFRSGEIRDKYAASLSAWEFLMNLCREAGRNGEDHRNGLVPMVDAYCNSRMDSPVTVEDLARHCGYSRGYFTRRFQKESGIAPLDYVMKRKLEHALKLMAGGRIGIKELAFRCGFSDQGYFTRRFRRYYGMSPTRYISTIYR